MVKPNIDQIQFMDNKFIELSEYIKRLRVSYMSGMNSLLLFVEMRKITSRTYSSNADRYKRVHKHLPIFLNSTMSTHKWNAVIQFAKFFELKSNFDSIHYKLIHDFIGANHDKLNSQNFIKTYPERKIIDEGGKNHYQGISMEDFKKIKRLTKQCDTQSLRDYRNQIVHEVASPKSIEMTTEDLIKTGKHIGEILNLLTGKIYHEITAYDYIERYAKREIEKLYSTLSVLINNKKH